MGFSTMYTARPARASKMDSHSETILGQAKSVREMYEMYVNTGIPLQENVGEYYDTDKCVNVFGVELHELSGLRSEITRMSEEVSSKDNRATDVSVATVESGVQEDTSSAV